jgi:pimeloyl-ACP methyl ester carboxylesterase
MNTAAATLDHIPSADGTLIACERSGSGPSLVIVNGALSDRRSADGLRPHLDPHLTVVAYDRRGRGASGDAPHYAPEREMEDLAAIVAATGGNAFVFGHSSGAILALEAVLRGLPVKRLALNEPPFIVGSSRRRPSVDLEDRLRRLIDAGDREAALHLFLTDATGLDEAAIGGVRSGPAWPRMLELAHTASYDAALTSGNEMPAAERLASLRTPTLVLNGDKTAPWIQTSVAALAASIPSARREVLAGQAHNPEPGILAKALLAFFQA